MCLTRIHGQCLEKHALCRWQSFENKGTPVICHQIVNGESRRIW